MNVLDLTKDKVLILDGGMGTEIIRRTGKSFDFPEILNLEKKDAIFEIHKAYVEAGADIITTNTFGATRIRLKEYKAESKAAELNQAAVELARQARGTKDILIAGSLGPTGKLIQPLGELNQEDVSEAYAEQAAALAKAGVDLLLIETQIDILEAQIALRAALKHSSLPVAVSFSFPLEDSRTLTGSDSESISVVFTSAGADLLGVNCGGHPREFEKIIEKILLHTDAPLLVYANAGIPEKKDGQLTYPLGPVEYADYASKFYLLGANVVGGCCGTTPEHIREVAKRLKGKKPVPRKKRRSFFRAASRNLVLSVGNSLPFKVIGENINPFGNKALEKELQEGWLDLAKNSARKQEQAGADGLDINLGKKGEREPEFYATAIDKLQAHTRLPLFLDNNNPFSLELALQSYAGKAAINSVKGTKESMETLFPLAKKYGASVVLLALDKDGIPEKAEARVRIIENMLTAALDFGLRLEDLLADPIMLTLAASPKNAMETLKTIEGLKSLGISTILGLSNLSFGLPQRRLLNQSFLPMALGRGLDAAILNPLDENLLAMIRACDALIGRDPSLQVFIQRFSGKLEISVEEKKTGAPGLPEKALFQAILEGEAEKAEELTQKLAKEGKDGFYILKKVLAPAMKQVGEYYEKKIYFLPQLILSAEAMERASRILNSHFKIEDKAQKKLKIVMATVEGDLHDIGKNIVSLVLRNYGYDVIDLGKNVKSQTVVEAAIREKADLIGLSALMTTTMEEMRKILALKNARAPKVKVIVGGAAVTPSFAREIGADAYGKDAMDGLKKIERFERKSSDF